MVFFNQRDTVNFIPGLAIALGHAPGFSFVNKYGVNPNIDNGENIDIWTGGETGNDYVFPTVAVVNYISASNAGDTQNYEVHGLDANFDEQTITVTAVGQTKTQIGTGEVWIRIDEVTNIGSTNNAGKVYVFENSDVTLGVPDTESAIKAQMDAGDNKTAQAIYTIPRGRRGFVTSWFADISNRQTSGASDLDLDIRPFGQVFHKEEANVCNVVGTSFFHNHFDFPHPIPEKSDIKIHAGSNTNGLAVAGGFEIVMVNM